MIAFTLTPEQHQYLTAVMAEELRHQLEVRDLESARASGRITRQELADLRHSAKLDADRIAAKVLHATRQPATDSQSAVKRSLASLLATVTSDVNDLEVTAWPR